MLLLTDTGDRRKHLTIRFYNKTQIDVNLVDHMCLHIILKKYMSVEISIAFQYDK